MKALCQTGPGRLRSLPVGSRRACAFLVLLVLAAAGALRLGAATPYLWRAATGGQIRSRPAVGPDGTVYALSEDSYLYAWVPGGSLRWRHVLGWLPWDCLAVGDDGTIYAGLKNGDFLAVNPRGGRLWTVSLDGLPSGDPAICRDGTVLVGTAAGTLYAFSHLGSLTWSVTLPGAVRGAPAVDGGGTIYVAAADRRLYALTPWGTFKWSLPFDAPPGPAAVAADGTVITATDDGDLVDVSAAGDVRWKAALGGPPVGASADASHVLAGTMAGQASVFSLDGRVAWTASAGRRLNAPPCAVAGGVLLSAEDGSLSYAASARATPALLHTAASGPAVIAPDGSILVGGRDWIVYDIDPAAVRMPRAAELSSLPWPQAGHDAMHTGRTEAVSVDNRSLLEEDPDYLYLQGLLGAGGRDGVQLFLSEVRSRLASRTLGGSRWYAARDLEGVVGYGLLTQVRQNQKLVNDFPDLRAQAADLLARIGSTASRTALLRAVSAEPDPLALSAEVHALGALASDGDGASVRTIVRAFTHRPGGPPDNRLAAAVVGALGRIARYEGSLGDSDAISALIAVASGDYDLSVRAAAASILQGDLKAYILSQEE